MPSAVYFLQSGLLKVFFGLWSSIIKNSKKGTKCQAVYLLNSIFMKSVLPTFGPFFFISGCNYVSFFSSFFQATLAFKKENMTFMRNSRTTFELALSDTKYSPILDLFRFHTLLLAGPKPDVYTAYNLLEKMPYFVVLGMYKLSRDQN